MSEAFDACSGAGEGEFGGTYGRRLEFLDDLIELLTVRAYYSEYTVSVVRPGWESGCVGETCVGCF